MRSGSWVNETITNTLSDEGHDPAMAMDGDGNLHVVYYCDDGCSDLRMSSRINGVWQNETVASTLNIGNDPDITIDSQGTIHIVSQYLNDKRIYLHSGTPGSWTEQTGLSGGNAHWPVVSVDSNDAVHISYHFGNTQKDVMYMTNASGSWSTASMIEGYGGWGSEMAIDDNDDIFIANLAVGTSELQLTTVKGSGQGLTVRPIYDISPMLPDGLTMNWRNGTISGTPTEALANTTFTVTVTALGATTTGTFTLFITGAPGAIAYSDISGTKGTAITPVTPSITTNGTTGSVTSWAISPALPSGLSFGTSNGTIWGTPTVVVSGAVFTIWANNSVGSKSTTVNITVNDAVPVIAYSPSSLTLTKGTAMSPTATPTNTGGAIPSGIVSSGSNHGLFISIALDSNGYKHISYYQITNFDLMYATDKSGSWVTTSIDTSGSVGWHTSIAIDSNDDVHISYWYQTAQDLKYATDKSGSWVTTSIDTSGNVGQYTSIAIDSNDDVHISYRDATNGDLKYATDKSGSWVTTSIDTSGNDVRHTSIAIDSNDDVHISYLDDTNEDLKYATDKSGSWVTSSIDTSGNVGYDTSIAIDSNDDVHISYYAKSGKDLKYATDKSGSWVTTSIDTSGDVGTYTSIAIDSNDDVHISYYDDTDEDLKYATDKSGSWVTTSIDTSGFVGSHTSIAIDSNDAVHISYRDATDNAIKYIVLDSSSNVLGYSVSPALPAGLSLDLGTGEISGTPTATSSSATYTITARNSGGTGTTTVTIVVNDAVPVIAYSPSSFTLTKGTAMTTVTPTTSGGTIVSWSISPTLPTGLAFDTSTGAISGTPTVLSVSAVYTVTATNTGGSNTAAVTIVVNDEVPTIAYSPNDLTITNNTASSDLPLSPTITGSGTITSWAISPALPSGLSFGTSNGTIWGTPTSLMTLKTFTISASNSGGSVNATVNITVNDEAPDISYNPDWFELTKGVAMSPTATPINAGGAIPTSILESTGEVGRGTSLAIDANGYKHVTYFDDTNYVLKYATDASGSWVNITLNTTTYHQQISGSSIVIDSGGVLHIAYTGTSGNLTYATCSSTCTSNASWTFVEIDDSGSASGSPSLAIDSNNTMHISYIEYNIGTTSETLKYATCSASCTTASSWSNITVDNSFNTGFTTDIAIDSNDGLHISYYKQTYHNSGYYYATCTSSCNATSSWNTLGLGGGAGLCGLNPTSIVVDSNDVVHFAYSMFSGSASYNGLSIRSCSASCTTGSSAWPSTQVDTSSAYFRIGYISIVVDSNDGLHIAYGIHGQNVYSALHYASCSSSCPSGSSSTSSWSITEIDGTVEAGTISIAIGPNDGVGIVYQDTTNDNLRDVSIDSSANVYGYSVSPDLPAGLSLDIATGEISGTPTALSTNTTYTITVRNSGGTNTTTITIVVNDQVPTIAYSPNDLDLTNNTASSDLPLSPTITGSGTITSWAISPSVPSGLVFSASTGVLSGTPTELLTRSMFTITGTNTGGTATAYINITIVDEVPTIAYSPNDLTITNNTASSDLPLSPTMTGSGEFTSWAISPSVPSGLSFDTSTGVLSGTPTELLTRSMFTITATNTGGTATAYINITIVDEVPTIAYSPNDLA